MVRSESSRHEPQNDVPRTHKGEVGWGNRANPLVVPRCVVVVVVVLLVATQRLAEVLAEPFFFTACRLTRISPRLLAMTTGILVFVVPRSVSVAMPPAAPAAEYLML